MEISRPLPEAFPIQRWEFNVILLELVFLGGAGIGGLMAVGRSVWSRIPDWTWFAMTILLLGLAYIPVESILARTRRGREISIVRSLIWIFAGTLFGTIVYRLIR